MDTQHTVKLWTETPSLYQYGSWFVTKTRFPSLQVTLTSKTFKASSPGLYPGPTFIRCLWLLHPGLTTRKKCAQLIVKPLQKSHLLHGSRLHFQCQDQNYLWIKQNYRLGTTSMNIHDLVNRTLIPTVYCSRRSRVYVPGKWPTYVPLVGKKRKRNRLGLMPFFAARRYARYCSHFLV